MLSHSELTLITWGLTGNIACGKSAVELLLRERGIPVIDADQVARAADALAQARRDGVRFDYLPVACQIPDMPAGYAVQ